MPGQKGGLIHFDQNELVVPPIKPGFDPEPIIRIIRQAKTRDVMKLEEILYRHGYNVPVLVIEKLIENTYENKNNQKGAINVHTTDTHRKTVCCPGCGKSPGQV